MSKVVISLLWLYVCVIAAQDATTVEEYVEFINSFIDNSTRYTYPTDNTAYLQGNSENTLGKSYYIDLGSLMPESFR